jgi:hypothetical protein
MQYLLLIYRDESAPDIGGEAISKEYMEFTQSIIRSGHLRGGEALQSAATATKVRVRDGKTLTTDGPFAETREQLGGYYVIEAKDLEDAVRVAAGIPNARDGVVEVRPIRPIPRA